MNRLARTLQTRFPSTPLECYFSSDKVYKTALVIIMCYMGYCFLKLPILSTGDSDMWYHLSGGRYFFQHYEIPTTGFFSFLAESREWSNYYWMFQVLVYPIYKATSYYGLIALKTITYLATVLTIALFLFRDTKNDRQKIYFLILFLMVSIGLVERYYAVLRPHMFSYLFIPLFIYLLETRTRALMILPLLTVIWVNIHGIEYPVIFLIALCYLLEFIIQKYKTRSALTRDEACYIIPVLLTLVAVLINPYGIKLLNAPFSFSYKQEQYILELRHLNLADFFSFKLYPFGTLHWFFINILIIATLIGCLKGILKKDIRISHVLLFSGGIFLLTQAVRFRYEAIMLSLPLLKYHPFILLINKGPINKAFKLGALSIILVFSLTVFHLNFSSVEKYPFSYSDFPRGITTFLNHIGVGGSILNEPNYGGYLQWKLDPGYKISMDLQTILFTDEDYFSVRNALSTKQGFASFYERFHPDFIMGYRGNKLINQFIESFPEYRLVFFDNSSVLYINNNTFPEVAEKYEINYIDPYEMEEDDIESLDKDLTENMLKELLVMQAVYPDDMMINLQMGRIYNKENETDKALACADIIVKNFPEYSHGYVLKGDVYYKSGPTDAAVSCFHEALKRPILFKSSLIYRRLALAYNKAHDDKNAFRAMEKAVDIFLPDADYNDLWQLGNMALKIGRAEEAEKLFRFSLIKAPSEDTEFVGRVNNQLSQLEQYMTKD